MNNPAASPLLGAIAALTLCASLCAGDDAPAAAASINAAQSPALTATNEAPGVPVHSLLLRNGDRLYGKLLAIDSQNTVFWQHPDAAQPIEFKPETVSQIDFPAQHLPTGRSDYACKVRMAEGSLLQGSLVSCDLESLVLDTWYAAG